MDPMPSNDVNLQEGNMKDMTISMLREPAIAERALLSLLGSGDARIMQAYDEGGLRQNLAHHAVAACLHFAMWLRENGDSSIASKERDEARARVSELEEKVRNFEESTAKKEAEIVTLRQMVQEHESKMKDLFENAGQLWRKSEVWKKKWKEQEALHQEKDVRLDEVLRQLEEANADLAKVIKSNDVARGCIGKLKSALTRTTSALTLTRQLNEQEEVKMKKVQQDCEMDKAIPEMEKEEHAEKRLALTAEMELREDFQNQYKKQTHKKKKEDGIMLMPDLNKDLNEHATAGNPLTFWTVCNNCQGHYEYPTLYLNRILRCHHCHKAFLATEKAPPPQIFKSCSFSGNQHQDSKHGTASCNSFNSGCQAKDPERS